MCSDNVRCSEYSIDFNNSVFSTRYSVLSGFMEYKKNELNSRCERKTFKGVSATFISSLLVYFTVPSGYTWYSNSLASFAADVLSSAPAVAFLPTDFVREMICFKVDVSRSNVHLTPMC